MVERQARRVRIGQLVGAPLLVMVMALSVVVYLPGGTALVVVVFAATLLSLVLVFVVLARMHSPRLSLTLWRRRPIGARLEVGAYVRATGWDVRAWALLCTAGVVATLLAAGAGGFFPAGNAAIRHGAYVEVSHGDVVRTLTRHQYERLQMQTLRFFFSVGTAFLILGALVTSGALREDLRPEKRVAQQPTS